LRFLADESCDFAAVPALRAAGHDVLAVSEFQQRSVDEELMALALSEERILVTEDKDFGTLTFASQHESHGVILLRFPASARGSLGPSMERLVAEYGTRLRGAFPVLQPGVVRISKL